MIPCECGSVRFKIDAIYTAHDYIELRSDGSDDFDVVETCHHDGEWFDGGNVECCECSKVWDYNEFCEREAETTETKPATLALSEQRGNNDGNQNTDGK